MSYSKQQFGTSTPLYTKVTLAEAPSPVYLVREDVRAVVKVATLLPGLRLIRVLGSEIILSQEVDQSIGSSQLLSHTLHVLLC